VLCERQATFGWDEGSSSGHFYLREENAGFAFCHGHDVIMHSSGLRIAGRHNYLNVLAAFATGWLLDLDLTEMSQTFSQFEGLPHRGQIAARKAGVTYINDSKATNPGALISAVAGQAQNRNVHLIAGGVSKGASFDELEVCIKDHVKGVYQIGEAQDQIAVVLPGLNVQKCGGLRSAVTQAHRHAENGDVILLAPGCASFDEFRNYAERGDAFTSIVQELTA